MVATKPYGKVTSGLSALRSVESRCKGGDEVGSGMGKSGGVPDDGASDLVWESMMGGGSGDNTGKGDSIGGSGGEESEAMVMTMGKVVIVVK
ncbi:hypothetical protein Tco_1162033 [Tanacetum coccineum]